MMASRWPSISRASLRAPRRRAKWSSSASAWLGRRVLRRADTAGCGAATRSQGGGEDQGRADPDHRPPGSVLAPAVTVAVRLAPLAKTCLRDPATRAARHRWQRLAPPFREGGAAILAVGVQGAAVTRARRPPVGPRLRPVDEVLGPFEGASWTAARDARSASACAGCVVWPGAPRLGAVRGGPRARFTPHQGSRS